MPNLDKAAIAFDKWMKKYSPTNEKLSNDHNEALMEFFRGDCFEYITTYEEFCELAILLAKDYSVSTPPCTLWQFALEVDKILCFTDPHHLENQPVLPNEIKLELAAYHFDEWIKEYEDPYQRVGNQDNHTQALMNYLENAKGFKYIKTYGDLCNVATLLQTKGYLIRSYPCHPDVFNEAVSNHKALSHHRKKRAQILNPEETFTSEQFDLKPVKTVPSLMVLCYEQLMKTNSPVGNTLVLTQIKSTLQGRGVSFSKKKTF